MFKTKHSKYHNLLNWRPRTLRHKIAAGLVIFFLVNIGGMYGVARWYIAKHAKQPLTWGVTFIPSYAKQFDLDPQETMKAMIDDLGIRRFRLVSYWSEHEPKEGFYDFEGLDWQFKLAEESGSKVSLAIGLRQPRWPECHMPSWAENLPKSEWALKLKDYMKAVIERYQNSPALESYQLENEFFMTVFGICPDHSRARLVDEYNFVKSLDNQHPVLVARSNNWIGLPLGDPRPDGFGISVYKRVWDKTFTKRYFEYPLPAWFYASLAGGAEILTGKDMFIHELQAEPWPPTHIKEATSEEQYKSMNAGRMRNRLSYAKATGMKTIDLWGAEWWYWRKEKFRDPSVWDVIKQEIAKTKELNSKL